MVDDQISTTLNEGSFPGNVAAFNDLKEYLRDGTIIALTGAGVSAPQFPTWANLLSTLLNEAVAQGLLTAQNEITETRRQILSDPLEVATSLEEVYTRPIFRARIAKIFANPTGTATECQTLISALHLRGLVTLNYDNGHEVAYAKKGRNPNTGRSQDLAVLTRWLQGEAFDAVDPPILHFHGSADDPHNLILTGDDYDKFYSSPLPDTLLKQLWQSNRLMVIGFGFGDPFLTRVAESALRSLPSDTRHFALIGRYAHEPITPLTRRQFSRKYRLTPIFYEIRKDAIGEREDHSDLLKLLHHFYPASALEKAGGVQIDVKAKTEDATTNVALETPETSNYQTAIKDFQRDLFITSTGVPLYVEPRLLVQSENQDSSSDSTQEITIREIATSSSSYIVTSRPEYGGTTVAKRLVAEFSALGIKALLADAHSLPNYKKKLQELFLSTGYKAGKSAIVLDNFDFNRNEKLLKEIIGTEIFSIIILIARINDFSSGNAIPLDQFSIPFKVVSLSNLNRTDIRILTQKFFDTSDVDAVSGIVDKVYRDLLALCIPLTPSNITMYLTILHKEGDFHPINRVQIVDRYLRELLRRPSDAYMDPGLSRRSRNKAVSRLQSGYGRCAHYARSARRASR